MELDFEEYKRDVIKIYQYELRKQIEKLKKRSDSSTYLYGQGQSNAYEEVLDLLNPNRNL